MFFRCYGAGTWIYVAGARPIGALSAASPALTGTPTVNGIAIGYKGIPLATQNAAYTFTTGDAGRGIVKSDGLAYTYTANAIHAGGDVITVVNTGGTGAVTLAGTGVTLQLSGTTTTGNRTVAPGGVATLFFTSSTHAMVGGSGVS